MNRNVTLRRRTAFTVVELLVVISIVAILLALLLPAVQRAREAARRMQCKNQMKQIGLALVNYHDVHQSFPLGSQTPHSRPNWRFSVLPYLDQGPVYDKADFSESFYSACTSTSPYGFWKGQNEHLAGLVISVFQCPSSPISDTSIDVVCNFERAQTHDYVGVSGAVLLRTSNGTCSGQTGHGGTFCRNGMLIPMVSTRIRDVTDGSSNTVIAAEQSGLVDERDCRSGHHGGWSGFQNVGVWDVSFYSSIHYPFGTGVTTMLYPINYNVLDVGTNTSYDANTVVNSFHSGGINVLFVDGSVHFVSDSADRELQKRLFSRNDGTPVGEF